MVTIKEIAQECNVSITTVSNILNGRPKAGEETKRQVLEVIEKRGYKPNYIAQGLRTQKTRMIGIIAEDIVQFTTPEIVEGIMSYCEEGGYRTIVKNMRMYARWNDAWYDDVNAYRSVLDPVLQELSSIMVDGIIYIAGHARKVNCFPADFSIPAVMAYAYDQNPQVPSILIDDENSAYKIVSYLISKNHRKIGVIAGREDNIHTQRRLLGYQRALLDAGILFNPEVVRYACWEKKSGYEATKHLLGEDITAIFCMSDRMAGGAYYALREQGKQAGVDMAIVGFDDQDIAEFFIPGLTTMKLPLQEVGHTAARILVEKINAGSESGFVYEEKEILIPCTFVERDSVREV